LILFLQLFQIMMNNGSAGLAYSVADKDNFHGNLSGWVPREACGLTYLNLFTQVGILAPL
jgi:hypothetical protein